MADVTIVVDNSGSYGDDFRRAVLRGLEKVGIAAEGIAVKNLEAPKPHADGSNRPNVDTGNLVNSITHVVDDGGLYAGIGTNVEYAPYVEMGTSRAAAYPYLRPAAENHMDEYRAIIESELKG